MCQCTNQCGLRFLRKCSISSYSYITLVAISRSPPLWYYSLCVVFDVLPGKKKATRKKHLILMDNTNVSFSECKNSSSKHILITLFAWSQKFLLNSTSVFTTCLPYTHHILNTSDVSLKGEVILCGTTYSSFMLHYRYFCNK